MGDESFTKRIEFASNSPIDDGASDLVNDDRRSRVDSPVCRRPTDENNIELRNRKGCIALIESSSLLRECIHSSLNAALPLPVVSYASVSELQHQSRSMVTKLAMLSLIEVESELSIYAMKTLLESLPGIPIIVLGSKNDPESARNAVGYGARAYIPFTMEFAIAVEAVRLVLAGGTYVPADYLDFPCVAATPSAAPGRVTNRELAVVRAIKQGKSNKTIAYDLNMCESTVKVHVRNIMKKLNAKNRTQIAMLTAQY